MRQGQKVWEVSKQLGTSNEYVFENRNEWSVRRLLRRVKCNLDELTAADVREANSLERAEVNAMYERMVEENRAGGCRLVNVVIGHPELDPTLCPDHPLNRKGTVTSAVPRPVSPGEKKMSKFVVPLKQGQRLLKELGHQHTDKLNAAAILTALRRVDDTADDAAQAKVTDPASQELLKKLLLAIARGDEVTVATAAAVERNGNDKPKKSVMIDASPAGKFAPEGDGDEEGDEDDDDTGSDGGETGDKPPAKKSVGEKPAGAPAKKPETAKPRGPVKGQPQKAPSKPQERTEKKPSPKPPEKSPRSSGAKPGAVATKPKVVKDTPKEKPAAKPASKDKKPAKKGLPPAVKDGKVHVTGCVIECLKEASKSKPITMEKIVAILKKRRKEGNEASMLVTVRDLIRRNLKVRHNLDVKTDGKGGYWLD